ncbi:MAG: hypothetical protein QM767_10030 [Anaeromyxobacter sp.]
MNGVMAVLVALSLAGGGAGKGSPGAGADAKAPAGAGQWKAPDRKALPRYAVQPIPHGKPPDGDRLVLYEHLDGEEGDAELLRRMSVILAQVFGSRDSLVHVQYDDELPW